MLTQIIRMTSHRRVRTVLRHLRPPIATPHDTAAEPAEVEDAPWRFPHGTLAEAEGRLARAVGAGELRRRLCLLDRRHHSRHLLAAGAAPPTGTAAGNLLCLVRRRW